MGLWQWIRIKPQWLLLLLLCIVLGASFSYALMRDPGYLLVAWGDHVWVGGLFITTLLLITLVVAVWLTLQSLRWFFDASRYKPYKTTRGLIELAEGNWKRAENLLSKSIAKNPHPLINYLSAARAAHEQGSEERRDDYLKRAHEAIPDAGIAISLTQARLQYESQHWEKCLATLMSLKKYRSKKGVGYKYVLKLLTRVYVQLNDWQHLYELLEEIKKGDVFEPQEFDELERTTQIGMLKLSASQSSEDETPFMHLERCWSTISKRQRSHSDLLQAYVEALLSLDQTDTAELMLRQQIKREWNPTLVTLYGKFQAKDTEAQQRHAEAWRKDHDNDPDLLLALARICTYQKHPSQAIDYYQKALSQRQTKEAYIELAQLHHELGQTKESSDCFQRGLTQS